MMSQRPGREATIVRNDQVGFWGKAPTHGDFVVSGLETGVEDALDEWVRSGLQSSEQTLGARWRETFHAAAPWRFIIEGGLWGPSTIAGVILPSADRVGRSFPFAILAQLPNYASDPRYLYFDRTWFTAAEGLAETSRSRDFDLAMLPAGLKRLRLPRPRLPSGEDASSNGYKNGVERVSIWWTIDPESGKAMGFQTSGPPKPADFVKLLQYKSDQPKQAAPAAEPAAQPVQPAKAEVTPLPPKRFALQRSHATHAGTRHALNADALLVSDNPRLLAIADGVGEGGSAADAAKVAINALAHTPPSASLADLVGEVKGKLGRAQTILQSASMLDGRSEGPRASVAVLAAVENAFAIIWAGDVRAFVMRDGLMRALTRDHVEVGMQRRLSRCIGGPGQLVPEIVGDYLRAGDRLLLCSAPLLRTLSERVIAETLLDLPVAEVAPALIQEALIANARDNVSVIAVGATEP